MYHLVLREALSTIYMSQNWGYLLWAIFKMNSEHWKDNSWLPKITSGCLFILSYSSSPSGQAILWPIEILTHHANSLSSFRVCWVYKQKWSIFFPQVTIPKFFSSLLLLKRRRKTTSMCKRLIYTLSYQFIIFFLSVWNEVVWNNILYIFKNKLFVYIGIIK